MLVPQTPARLQDLCQTFHDRGGVPGVVPQRPPRHQGVPKCCHHPVGRELEPQSLFTSRLSRLEPWLARSLGGIHSRDQSGQRPACFCPKRKGRGGSPRHMPAPPSKIRIGLFYRLTRDPSDPWVPLRSTTSIGVLIFPRRGRTRSSPPRGGTLRSPWRGSIEDLRETSSPEEPIDFSCS